MLRTTLSLPYPRKMFTTGHGIFLEKIALLKQLSGRTNSLIMITLNHLVLQNETRKFVLEINSVTKPEIPTSDEKEWWNSEIRSRDEMIKSDVVSHSFINSRWTNVVLLCDKPVNYKKPWRALTPLYGLNTIKTIWKPFTRIKLRTW